MVSHQRLNVCLIGSGGVGTVVAVVLEKAGTKVTAVLRSKYQVVKEKGWDIRSVDHGDIKVVSNVTDAATEDGKSVTYDFVVVSMKQLPDHYSITEIIAPAITPCHTAIVLIQNGIDIELPLIAAFPTNPLMSSVSLIGSSTAGENTILHIAPDAQTIGPHFHVCGGLSREKQLAKAKEFVDLYNQGIKASSPNAASTLKSITTRTPEVTLTENMPAARWHKLLWNGTFNTVCACMKMNVGEVCRSGGRDNLLVPMMTEIWKIAKASGVELPESDIQGQAYRVLDSSVFRPSMLIDVDYGRPMELEVILGNTIRRAEKEGVLAPTCKTLYELLKMRKWEMERAATIQKSGE